MSELKTSEPVALRLLMTDDLFIIKEKDYQNQESPASDSYDYLGENNKYILIMINDALQETIKPEDLKTLTNILTAKQLELRDVAIVNLGKYPATDFNKLKQFFACRKLILFGINPIELGLKDIDSNQISLFGETKILATYSFEEMQNDNAKKRVFWNAMKEI